MKIVNQVRSVSLVCWAIAIVLGSLAPADAAPRILNVQYELVPGEGQAGSRRMVKKRITKFDHYIKSPGYEVFYVNWNAEAGIGPGITVVFEYRQGRSKISRVVKFEYPGVVSGQKRTTFNVPLEGNQVRAWRARVTHGQRVLSTRVSPDWITQ